MSGLPAPLRLPAWRVALAWAVHAYTGSGLLLAAWMVATLMQADLTVDDYRLCFLLMFAATFIDATDGTLARLVRVSEATPHFDGRKLDDLVDFVLYTCVPLLLIDRAGILPVGYRWVVLFPLAASAYGFSQTDAKTDDGAFVGFPSYWNVIAFYLYGLPVTGESAVLVVVAFAVLTFVPTRYPYPTKPGAVNRMMLVLSVPWAVLLFLCVIRHWHFAPPRGMIGLSAGYPTLYLVVAWGTALWRWSQNPPGRAT